MAIKISPCLYWKRAPRCVRPGHRSVAAGDYAVLTGELAVACMPKRVNIAPFQDRRRVGPCYRRHVSQRPKKLKVRSHACCDQTWVDGHRLKPLFQATTQPKSDPAFAKCSMSNAASDIGAIRDFSTHEASARAGGRCSASPITPGSLTQNCVKQVRKPGIQIVASKPIHQRSSLTSGRYDS